MSDDLAKLSQLEQLRSLKSQMELAKLNEEEKVLRHQISTLNGHRANSHSTETGLIPMRAIGADVLWQSWIDRTQASLTIDLAKLLARKDPVIRRAARDVGRQDVVSTLAQQQQDDDQRARNAKNLENMLNTAVMKAALIRR